VDSSTADKEDNYEVRDLFDGRLLEGDTIIIYAHCIRSSQMNVVLKLEFNPTDDGKIQRIAKEITD
jgi:hypothetical protein